MNLLFDIVSSQGTFFNGASGYTRKMFLATMNAIKEKSDVRLFLVYDSRIPFLYEDMSPQFLSKNSDYILIDIAKYKKVASIIEEYSINRFYICLMQAWNDYNLENINCEVFCTIHDLCHSEYEWNHIREYVYIKKHIFLVKRWVKLLLSKRSTVNNRYKNILDFVKTTENLKIITVSEYSKKSILFFLNVNESDIIVSWSPEKEVTRNSFIENGKLRDIIEQKKKYYLVVSADRPMKNAEKVLSAFNRYVEVTGDDAFILTVGMKEKRIERQVILPYLNESDLENAYANCYALIYGTFLEGFGYPPVEVMKYSRPVLASNVCSVPEVLGDAPIYFSPFYETDIFKALMSLSSEANYQMRMVSSRERYNMICKKQADDLDVLVKMILKKDK